MESDNSLVLCENDIKARYLKITGKLSCTFYQFDGEKKAFLSLNCVCF